METPQNGSPGPADTGANLDEPEGQRDPATGRFLPGHKGVGGRPPGAINLTQRVRRRLRERIIEMRAEGKGEAQQQRAVEAVVDAWIDRMLAGSPAHLAQFLDRDEGKPTEHVEATHRVERSLTLIGIDHEPELPEHLDDDDDEEDDSDA